MSGPAAGVAMDEGAHKLPAALLRSDLSRTDREVIARAGYGRHLQLGSRPALLLVDFQRNYLGLDRSIVSQLAVFPSGGGAAAWRALGAARAVLEAARRQSLPIVFTRIAYPPAGAAANTFALKRGGADAFREGSPGTRFAEEMAPANGELVLTKGAASAFFGTDLHAHLARLDIDTLLVAGLSTSGCVRSTVVDSAAHGYRTAVVVDAVADRVGFSHRAALLDMWMKYADLMTSAEAVVFVSGSVKGR